MTHTRSRLWRHAHACLVVFSFLAGGAAFAFSCLALDQNGTCTQSVDQYCLSPEDDGTCKPENLDPDTRQIGVCFLPKDATFPALK